MQTFGDYFGFDLHLHILCADGCFDACGIFYAANIDLISESLEPGENHSKK
jgi:hypothetical protein